MNLDSIQTIVFDFDGIFTDNFVYVDSEGVESVRCSREDSLGLDLLKREIIKRSLPTKMLILSTETNKLVSLRAKKLIIDSFTGILDKATFLTENFETVNGQIPGLVYLGIDINDLEAMKLAEFSVAPISSHKQIREMASTIISKNGDDGFIRSFCELLITS
jgi:3-deoxy-D-manno-octulosonate 8-phosphate phosphatase (KDO 8-P phosphatase)